MQFFLNPLPKYVVCVFLHNKKMKSEKRYSDTNVFLRVFFLSRVMSVLIDHQDRHHRARQ